MGWLFSVLVTCMHAVGAVCAARAIMHSRSPQGSIAWALTLVLFPYVAVPLYLVFGRRRFRDYVHARRAGGLLDPGVDAAAVRSDLPDRAGRLTALDDLARVPFTKSNDVELLVDGPRTFDAIFAGLETAERYVLVQFYIVRDDGLGNELRERLEALARRGVRVYMLYDEIGSHALPTRYIELARAGGVDIRSFHTTKGRTNRFQVNFRNHRKIVVVDGRVGYVGGHNVGDEYLGKDPDYAPWRDAHLRVEGPMVLGLQLAFAEDWRWRAGAEPPDLDWAPQPCEHGRAHGVAVATGPADELETCSLLYAHLIHSARERVWIASPYFVPDQASIVALQLAARRGLDVRVLVPRHNDSRLVDWGSQPYIAEVAYAGVRVFRMEEGFMHQKVVLVDDLAAAIGTANMDNRSFRLNFEVMAVVVDPQLAADVETMLEADLARSTPVDPAEFDAAPWYHQLRARVARLFAPIL